jgi:endonuclease/exonuclease/phosphatase family metal-dependent hydrolase
MSTLRILSYNVRYFGHSTRGIASTKKGMRRIADALASLEPLADIVCLQEVETISLRATAMHRGAPAETQLERLMAMLDVSMGRAGHSARYEAFYFPAHKYRLGKSAHVYTTGLAILALPTCKVESHNAEDPADITHRHVHPVRRRLKQTRICAHLRFKKRGEDIDVFNTHLSLPSTLSKEFWTQPRRMGYGPNQLNEAKNLAAFVAKQKKGDRFLLMGDFNALPGSPVHRYLTEDCGYTDAFAASKGLTAEDSVGWPTAGFMALRMHLDHVFCGPGVRWIDFDGSRPFGDRAATFHGLSDHVPLIGRCAMSE